MLSALYQGGIVRKYKSPVLYQWSSAESFAALRKSPYYTISRQCDGKQWMSSNKNNEKGNVMNKSKYCPLLSVNPPSGQLVLCLGEGCAWYTPPVCAPNGRPMTEGRCSVQCLGALPELVRKVQGL